MAKTVVLITDTLNSWRAKTNDISLDIGDITQISTSGSDSDIVGSINSLDSDLGVRANLSTANKTSLQAAINELDTDVGDRSTLTTNNKTNMVSAINELEGNHNSLDSNVGTRGNLNTTDKSDLVSAINEHGLELGTISSGAMLTSASTVSTAIRELHTELFVSGVNFGNFGNSHTGARLAANDFLAAIQEIQDEIGDRTLVNSNWTNGTAATHGGGSHDSSLVGSIQAIVSRIDSDNLKVDQSVKANASPVFVSTTLGTYPAATSGNATYSNQSITRTGDFKVDVSGDITLDAGGANVKLTDATNTIDFQLGTNYTAVTSGSGNFTLDVGGNINLDAAGNNITLKQAGSTLYDFQANGTIVRPGGLVLDVANDVTIDADGGNLILKDGGVTHFTFAQGAADKISTVNKFEVDAGGEIKLDAHDGVIKFSKQGSDHAVFTAGGATNTLAVPNAFLVDVAGNLTLDADGGTVNISDAGTINMSLISGANKEIDIPSGDLTLDVAGNVNIDADGGVVKFKDDTTDKFTFTMAANQTVATPGSLTVDVAADITLDAGGGDIIFADDGNQFVKFQQHSSGSFVNHMKMFVNDNLAITFQEQGDGTNNQEDIIFHGPVYVDSSLRSDITGLSVAGALNKLDTDADNLQALVGGTGASHTFSNITATTAITAIQELATELYASGNLNFGNFGANVQFSGTTARLGAQNIKDAIQEVAEELGDVAFLQPGSKFASTSTSAFRALAELFDRVTNLNTATNNSIAASNTNLGVPANLTTTAKGNVVAALNELDAELGTITANAMGTTASTVGAAIREIHDHTTQNIPEHSSNLYFTNARARNALTVTDAGGDGSMAYNSGTGVITYTGPSASEVRAHLSASSGITYNSTSGAITGDIATTSALGVAKFSSNNFIVSGAGEVSLKANATALANLPAITTNNRLLGRSDAGNSIVSEVTINTDMIDNDAVTFAKIQNVATANRVLGSTSAGGIVSEVQVQTAMIAADAVKTAQVENGAITQAKLNTPRTLTIKNASGTTLFTITGAGA